MTAPCPENRMIDVMAQVDHADKFIVAFSDSEVKVRGSTNFYNQAYNSRAAAVIAN